MKKLALIVVALLAVGLIFALALTGGNQDVKKADKAAASVTVQKTCECGHVAGSAECKEACAKGTCKCCESGKCTCKEMCCTSEKCGDAAKCAEKHGAAEGQMKAGSGECKGTPAAAQCEGCKSKEVKKQE